PTPRIYPPPLHDALPISQVDPLKAPPRAGVDRLVRSGIHADVEDLSLIRSQDSDRDGDLAGHLDSKRHRDRRFRIRSGDRVVAQDRKSTRLKSSHVSISY